MGASQASEAAEHQLDRASSADRDRIKAVVRGSSIGETEAFVREALAMEDENDVIELLRGRLEGRFAAEIEGFIPRPAAS